MADRINKPELGLRIGSIYDKLSALWTDTDMLCFERIMDDLPKDEVNEAQELVWQALELIKQARDKVWPTNTYTEEVEDA
jgi:hypothetical protein